MNREPPSARIALSMLRRIKALRATAPPIEERKLSWRDVAPDDGGQSDEAYLARVRQLLRPWRIPEPDLRMLERVWREALDRSPEGVSVRRLRELALDSGSGYYQAADPAEAWRYRLSHGLTQAGWAAQAGVASEEADTILELQGVGRNWPHRILHEEQYRFVQAPLPELPPLPLESTWVELQLVDAAEGDPVERRQDWLALRELRTARQLGRSLSLRQVVQELHSVTYLIGDPGGGKSTLINWIARETILDPHSPYLLPLVVRLREYGLTGRDEGLLAYALRRCAGESEQVRLWSRALSALAERSRQNVLLLLDGLDELPRQEHDLRQHVLEEIEALAARGFTLLVTSRPSAMPAVGQGGRRQTYRITDLSPSSIQQLTSRWCAAAGLPEGAALQMASRLETHPDLARMARNPFLLTCLCALGAHPSGAYPSDTGERMPTRRSEVYLRCLELMQRQHYPRQVRPMSDSDRRSLGRLAFWLLRDAPDAPRLVFDLGDVKAACGDQEFFQLAVEPSRLVSQWDAGDAALYFTHTTFQEFLAAQHLVGGSGSQALPTDEKVRLLRDRAFDPTWMEVFSFLGALDAAPHSLFWTQARALLEAPDRFGGVLLHLARWLRELGVRDGGARLLGGVDLREWLWERIFAGVEPVRFMLACAQLDPEWFADRYERAGAAGELGSLRREFLRVLKQVRLPRFSEVFVSEVLDPTSDSSGLPQEHRLTPESLRRLRQELASGQRDERVGRRLVQVLGLSKDWEAVPLLSRLASEDGPLQSTAIEALGLMGGLEAFGVLERLLNEAATREEWTRAVVGLGNMQEERARDRLLLELADTVDAEDEEDAWRATELLCALQDHAVTPATALILSYLGSGNAETREYAACVLHTVAPSSAVSEALAQVAQTDAEESVREAALLSFEHHSRMEDLPWLCRIVRDEERESEERDAALMAVGDLLHRDASSTAEILALAQDCLAWEGLEKTAVQLLGRGPSNHVAMLLDLCEGWFRTQADPTAATTPDNQDHQNDVVVEEACRVLGEGRRTEALPTLIRILRDERLPTRVREAAGRAVTLIDPHQLLTERSALAQQALGAFSLETGRLVIGETMLDDTWKRPDEVLAPVLAAAIPLKPEWGDVVYAVYCRLVGLEDMPADLMASAVEALEQTVLEVIEGRVAETRSSVYGRYLLVPSQAVAALEIAQACHAGAAARGVSLAVGVACGRAEQTHDLMGRNWAGIVINRAARLAHLEGAVGRIAVDPATYDDAWQSSTRFPRSRFSPRLEGKVKRTLLTYHWLNFEAEKPGELRASSAFRAETAHVVAFDIVRYSDQELRAMVRSVDELTRSLSRALDAAGGNRPGEGEQLWYSPGGDGGVVVFRAGFHGGARAAWTFARSLTDQTRGWIPLRIGVHTGPIVVLEGALPVGRGILEADRLSVLPEEGGICASERFWGEHLEPEDRRGWIATPAPHTDPDDTSPALLLAPIRS